MSTKRFICKTKQYGITTVLMTVVMLVLFGSSCSGDKKEIVEVAYDPETTYMMKATDVSTLVSDSGITRYFLKTPEWLVYSRAKDPYWYFPKGLYVEKFDTLFNPEANVKADSGYYWDKKQLWRLIGNVEVKDLSGQFLETSELYWNQKTEKIYSDKFVRLTKADGKVLGSYGFVSNQDMTDYDFYNGNIDLGEFHDTPRPAADTVSVAADTSEVAKKL